MGSNSHVSKNFLIPVRHMTSTLEYLSNHAIHPLSIVPLVLSFFTKIYLNIIFRLTILKIGQIRCLKPFYIFLKNYKREKNYKN